jgi:hypothetical protein
MLKGLAITCVSRLLPLIGTGRLSGNKTSILWSIKQELSQSWNCLEVRIGKEWLAYRERFSGR